MQSTINLAEFMNSSECNPGNLRLPEIVTPQTKLQEDNPYNKHKILSRNSEGRMIHYLTDSLFEPDATKFIMTGVMVIDYSMLSKQKCLKFYPSEEDLKKIRCMINRFECESPRGEISDPFLEDSLRKKKYISIGESSIHSFTGCGHTVREMDEILDLHLMIEYSKPQRYQPITATIVFEAIFFPQNADRNENYCMRMDNVDVILQ